MSRRVLIIVVLLAALVGGGVVLKKRSASASAGKTLYKVTKVQTGEVKKTVSSSGVLQAWDVVDIKARAGGELTLLAVDVGSEVKRGQVLARIDPLDVQLSLNTAQADETSARAKEKQSNETYLLQVQQSRISIEDAQANLLSAKANLAAAQARYATSVKQAQAQPELTRAAIANAQAAYVQAVKQRQQLDSTNTQDRATAKAAYDQAVANRINAEQSIDRQKSLLQKGFVSQQAVDTAQASLSVVNAQVESAKAKLDTQNAEIAASIATADARVNQARATLDNAKANSIQIANQQNAQREAAASVQQTAAQVSRAEVTLEQARANQATNTIRKYDVNQASSSIARAVATRITAKTTLERTIIRAPADGVVLQKYVEQGTIITSGLSLSSAGTSIVQLGNTARMYVDVNVDETDIANVDEGQKVDVSVEAYPGVPFEGKVVRVDPLAQVANNVTTIHVRVEVDNSAPTFRLLKPGMNSTCEFVINKKANVTSVPNEALHEDDKGRYVDVVTGSKPAPPDADGTPADSNTFVDVQTKHTPVEVGIEGNDSTEIASGLKPGVQVVTQTIEPAPPTTQGSPFGGGAGGIGRGGGGGAGGGGRGR